ncbi:uncharacterized protein zgc:193726 isoform X3 [Hippoglossus stenolepis]|uniref:uncharacterized protein zgc:193726 isoform X3 n=1 Tax=Hippoglossus stenolepis TaxID=195615 RepID=UPI00159C3BAB|nr:uncharacterized protein zgc:193726 isoform X3 [Hippoglossus stenolepis]
MMKSVAVVVMMMMMMLSAAPLPPSLNNSSFFFIHSLEFHHLNMTFMSDFRVMLQSSVRCLLPTCLTTNLVSGLQFGDETAGRATSDPYGNGKK